MGELGVNLGLPLYLDIDGHFFIKTKNAVDRGDVSSTCFRLAVGCILHSGRRAEASINLGVTDLVIGPQQ